VVYVVCEIDQHEDEEEHTAEVQVDKGVQRVVFPDHLLKQERYWQDCPEYSHM